ncbi:Protein W04C9.2 [Aphelenchoides avenae]|nr:Protein W04C9.2 [Aphelenchus avenae]
MGFFRWLTRTTAKVAVVAAVVKVSADNNVWSLDTVRGSETYSKLKKYILPGTIVYKEKLASEEFQTEAVSTWNCYVNCAFSMLNSVPSRFVEATNKGLTFAHDQMKDVKQSS